MSAADRSRGRRRAVPARRAALSGRAVVTAPVAGRSSREKGSRRSSRRRIPTRRSRARTEREGRSLGSRIRSQGPFWLILIAASSVALTGIFAGGDRWLQAAEIAAVVISVTQASALAHRVGARWWSGAVLAALVGGAAVVSERPVLLASAVVGTAVTATVLGVLATRPAERVWARILEVVYAYGIAVAGGIAAMAYRAPMATWRARYLVLGLALVITLALVSRLGAGINGLGRRGWAAIGVGIGALFLILAYTEALSHWGPESLLGRANDVIHAVDDLIGAVPRPTIFLIGVPALLWGVSTRVRRRQGWWVTGFGATGLAAASTMLLPVGHPTLRVVLSLTYSLALGLVLGGLLIRADQWLTGPRGRRASQTAEPAALRPEPARNEPLF